MSIPLYLAMNDEELERCAKIPPHLARTGLCFHPEGKGLGGLPQGEIPEGTLFLLEDRIPWEGHDLENLCQELAALLLEKKAFGLLLDFERSPTPETRILASALRQCCEGLGCRIGMPRDFHEGGALFLPAPPCCKAPEDGTLPEGPIWFEAVPTAFDVVISPEGSSCADAPMKPKEGDFFSSALGSYYRTEQEGKKLRLHLYDTADSFLNRLEALGAELAVGLWSQWRQV